MGVVKMIDQKAKKSEATRKRIVAAFNECVATNGYAQTKLVDIADAAGLATPHLRYYFKNKESILEHQYDRIVAGFERTVLNIEAATPRDWFIALGQLIFAGGPGSTQTLQVLIEANSLAARSVHMKKLKRQYDQQTLDAIEQQLSALHVTDPQAAATMIFHFLTGQMLNTAFEDQRTRTEAIGFFLQFVERLLTSDAGAPAHF